MPNQRYEPHHKIFNLRYGTPDTLLPLQVQSVALRQTPGTIGFSHRLCSVMFSLYDNKMSSIRILSQGIRNVNKRKTV